MSNARNRQSKQYVSVPVYPVSSGSGSSSDSEEDLFVAGRKGRRVVSAKTLNELLKRVPETVVVNKEGEQKRRRWCRSSAPCCIGIGAVLVLFMIGMFVSALLMPSCDDGATWSDCVRNIPTVIENAWNGPADNRLAVPAEWSVTCRGAVSSEANVCPVDDDIHIVFGVRYFSPSSGNSNTQTNGSDQNQSELVEDSFDFSSEESSGRNFGLHSAIVGISVLTGQEVWRKTLNQPTLPINQVVCIPGGATCLVAANPGSLMVFSAKSGESIWSNNWGDARLVATFVADVNDDQVHDLVVLSYVEDVRSKGISGGRTSMYLVSGADGSVFGQYLTIPGCPRLTDPHVTDPEDMTELHATCFDASNNEHLLRLSVGELMRSAVNETQDTTVGRAEKSIKRSETSQDEEETDNGGIVHKGDVDLRWTNFANGSAEVWLEGVVGGTDTTDAQHVKLWSKDYVGSSVTGAGFVKHCGGKCPSVVVVKSWMEDDSRKKRSIYKDSLAPVKQPSKYHRIDSVRYPAYDDEDYSNQLPSELEEPVVPLIQIHPLPPLEMDFEAKEPEKSPEDDLRPKKHKTTSSTTTSTEPNGFVVRVETQRSNPWVFHHLTDKVEWLKEIPAGNPGGEPTFDQGVLKTQQVEVACYSSADPSSHALLPDLGNCVPRPHRHSIASEMVLVPSKTKDTQEEINSRPGKEQIVVLVSTTPTLEAVDLPGSSKRHRLVTKVNHWRGYMSDVAHHA